jgi:hypothetical protein
MVKTYAFSCTEYYQSTTNCKCYGLYSNCVTDGKRWWCFPNTHSHYNYKCKSYHHQTTVQQFYGFCQETTDYQTRPCSVVMYAVFASITKSLYLHSSFSSFLEDLSSISQGVHHWQAWCSSHCIKNNLHQINKNIIYSNMCKTKSLQYLSENPMKYK